MIKPVSALVFGDLVFYQGARWQCVDGDSTYRVIRDLNGYRRPKTLLPCHGPVSVYANRDWRDCIPF